MRQTIPGSTSSGAGERAGARGAAHRDELPARSRRGLHAAARDFADRRPVSGGKTSLTILCDQLDLLGSKMDDVFDAACRADADALIAHGRFLAEKFSSGAIALDPQRR